jgi:hypothetical protein
VRIQVAVFWVLTPCGDDVAEYKRFGGPFCLSSSLHLEDGGNKFLRNVGILPHNHTASQPIRPRLELICVCVCARALYHLLVNAKMKLYPTFCSRYTSLLQATFVLVQLIVLRHTYPISHCWHWRAGSLKLQGKHCDRNRINHRSTVRYSLQ